MRWRGGSAAGSRSWKTAIPQPNRPDMVGLEVLAYYYVTRAKVFPDQLDGIGLPYKKAYESALEMFESNRGKSAAE